MTAPRNDQVYISYARHDRDIANLIYQTLRANGVHTWIDWEGIGPGVTWGRAITQAISASRAMVVIFSEAANASTSVSREIEFAARSGIPILPVRTDRARLSDTTEYYLSRFLWIDLDRNRPDSGLARLVEAVKQLVVDKSLRKDLGTQGFWEWLLAWLKGEGASKKGLLELYETLERLRVIDIEELAVVGRRIRDRSLEAFDPEWAICERVSRYAAQYLALEDLFRRREMLIKAMQELSALQTSYVSRQDQVAAAFLKLSNEWRAILEAERLSLEAEAEEARDIPNPFVFGNPVTEFNSNVFTGRRDIVKQIEENILGSTQPPTLLLHGQRRMGKTSILNQLPQLLGNAFVPVIVDCQNPAIADSLPALLRYLSRAMTNAAESQGIVSQTQLAPLETKDLREEPFSVFEQWLEKFESFLPKNCYALLCLDEFERLSHAIQAGWGGRLLDALRHWLQHRARIVIMFTGTHTFEELGPEWTDRFISARRVKVTFLNRADVAKLLTKPMPDFPMTYEEGVVDSIFDFTGGQPFLTQAVASETVQRLNREHRKLATRGDAEAAADAALDSAGEYFADLWNKLAVEERLALQGIASEQKATSAQQVVHRLQDRDLLDVNQRFAVPLLKRWIIRSHPR